jgi:hypothetical protein
MPDSLHVKINLIGKPKVSFTQDFLKWSVNVGRVIIVLTEMIAMGALVYRFTIDRKIIDLHDEIKKAELFVKSQQAKENDYRSIQLRLENIKATEEETQTKIQIMNDILRSISAGNFSSTNLSVNPNTININGVAFSIFPLSNFIESLKENPNVVSISLDELSSVNQGIQFKLTIELKQLKKT